MIGKALLWLFVVNLGVVFGAGVYEARITVPRWIGPSNTSPPRWHPDEAKQDDVGRRFWVFATTIPLTILTVANLWLASRSVGGIQLWWMVAGLAALADRAFTFSFFIPRMVGLLQSSDSPEARASMMQWAKLNHLRLLLVLVAWIAAMQSFALLHEPSPGA